MAEVTLPSGMLLQGRYRIERPLGGGGMGTVYLAEDSRLGGRRCAVKQLSESTIPPAERSQAIADFQREAQLLAHLDHPGLAKVSDFFAKGSEWYLVMEYVTGETLETVAQRRAGRVSEVEATVWALQLCDVLAYLHGRNPPVIFRDLKPGNVMLTPEGHIKLIDFGIARFFKPGQVRDTRNLGTPGFAAPEQYGKGQTDARSDIYSLGVMLHSLLTGYDPALTPFALPPAHSLSASISSGMERLIQRAVQMDPLQRYQNVSELRSALRGLAQPVAAQPVVKPSATASPPSLVVPATRISRPSVVPTTTRQTGMNRLTAILLAGLIIYALGQWLPMLLTTYRSLQNFNILSPAQFVGLANYTRLMQDATAGLALRNAVVLVLLRLGAVLLVWQLLGRAWNGRQRVSRGLAALAVAPLPLLTSVGAPILWRALGNPLLGPFGALWTSPASAFPAFAAVETLHALATAAAVGLVAYALAQRSDDGRAVLRLVGRIMMVATVAAGLQSFEWSQIITAGGPANATTTPLLLMYRNQYQFFKIGYGSAYATLLLICLVVLGWVLWRVLRKASPRLITISGMNYRAGVAESPALWSLALAPWLVAVFPYLWFHFGVSRSGLPFAATETLPLARWLMNTFLASVPVIWLVQLPLAMVMGCALATWRRGGVLEHWLAWPFLVATLVGVGIISAELFIAVRRVGALNTWPGLVAPTIVNATAVVMFALLWDGFSMRSSVPDEKRMAVGLLYGALAVASSFVASQEYLWHLISTAKAANYTVGLGLMSATQNMLQGNPVRLVEAAILPIVVPCGLLLAGLTYFLLNKITFESR